MREPAPRSVPDDTAVDHRLLPLAEPADDPVTASGDGAPGDTTPAPASVTVRPSSTPSRTVRAVSVGIAAGAVLGAGAALLAGQLMPPQYTSEALAVVVSADSTSDASLPITSVFAEVGGSETVLRGAADGLGVSEIDLGEGLAVSQTAAAPLVSIRVTTEDPSRAATWANAVAAELVATSEEGQVPGFSLTLVTPAVAPAEPDPGLGLPAVAGAAVLGAVLVGGLTQFRTRRRA